jgi:hypothetical protein
MNNTPNSELIENQQNIISTIMAYSEAAMKTAATYVSHCPNRNVILIEDIKRGMMLEMFLFKNRHNNLQLVQHIKHKIFDEPDTDEDTDEDTDTDIESSNESDAFNKCFSQNTCTCKLCVCINNINSQWNAFVPTTEFERVFKTHIDDL